MKLYIDVLCAKLKLNSVQEADVRKASYLKMVDEALALPSTSALTCQAALVDWALTYAQVLKKRNFTKKKN